MPQASQHYRRKNRAGKKFIAWIAAIAVLAGAIVFFITNFYEDTKKNLEELNYPQKYSEYVDKAAEEYGLDPALIYAVIRTDADDAVIV